MENQQELMIKLSMFEQQVKQLQQQLQVVEQAIVEMTHLNVGLDDLKGSKGKEVMAPLGRGIFAKTKLLSEELLVDIGEQNFVKKSIGETKELIQEQITKLEAAQQELNANMDAMSQEIQRTIIESQGDSTCACAEDKDCECDEGCGC